MAESGSLTVYPGAYDQSDYKYKDGGLSGETNPVGKSHTNTTYASILGYNMTAYLYWPFDVSAIPDDATIDSVKCVAKVGVNSSHNFTGGLQLFSGTTAKGSETTFTDKTTKAYTLTPGTWTRAELNSIRLKTSLTVNYNNRSLYFYGATLTVAYTVNNEKFMLKLGGAWHDIARVFKKVSGIWVEQTDLANVIEDGVRYQNGGEYVAPKPSSYTVTITGAGRYDPDVSSAAQCYVEINGTKYLSATTIEVEPGTEMLCHVKGASVGVSLNGTQVGSAVGGNSSEKEYTHSVNEDCTVALSYTIGFTASANIAITTQ